MRSMLSATGTSGYRSLDCVSRFRSIHWEVNGRFKNSTLYLDPNRKEMLDQFLAFLFMSTTTATMHIFSWALHTPSAAATACSHSIQRQKVAEILSVQSLEKASSML